MHNQNRDRIRGAANYCGLKRLKSSQEMEKNCSFAMAEQITQVILLKGLPPVHRRLLSAVNLQERMRRQGKK